MAPGVFTAVGLEPVDADVSHQVAAPLGPPGGAVGGGEVRHERTGEPPAAIGVGTTVTEADDVPRLEERVPLRGGQGTQARLVLLERDLPQHHSDAAPVQLLDHAARVRPGSVLRVAEQGAVVGLGGVTVVPGVAEDAEPLLVAPCLDHHHGDGHALTCVPLHLSHDRGLCVPLVTGGPQAEHPRRQGRRPSGLGQEGVENLDRLALPHTHREAWTRLGDVEVGLDDKGPGIARTDVEPDPAGGPDVEPPTAATDHVGEGNGEVGAPRGRLPLVLLEHADVRAPATLVDGVVTLTEPHDVLLRLQDEPESHAVDQPMAGDEPLHPVLPGGGAVEVTDRSRGPRGGVDGEERSQALPVGGVPGTEPVAPRRAGRVRQGDAPSPTTAGSSLGEVEVALSTRRRCRTGGVPRQRQDRDLSVRLLDLHHHPFHALSSTDPEVDRLPGDDHPGLAGIVGAVVGVPVSPRAVDHPGCSGRGLPLSSGHWSSFLFSSVGATARPRVPPGTHRTGRTTCSGSPASGSRALTRYLTAMAAFSRTGWKTVVSGGST